MKQQKVLRPIKGDSPALGRPRFSLKPVPVPVIIKHLRALKSTAALGIDQIPVSALKLGEETLAGPITKLINLSILTEKVPSMYKSALVCPIHKAGKPAGCHGSYRPVAILPAQSKLLESVVAEQLRDYLKRTSTLPSAQHGFRPGRSTTTAVGAAHAAWTKARDEGLTTGIILFDLSSAFDTISVEALEEAFEKIGIEERTLRWFQDYMRGGKQKVIWNEAE